MKIAGFYFRMLNEYSVSTLIFRYTTSAAVAWCRLHVCMFASWFAFHFGSHESHKIVNGTCFSSAIVRFKRRQKRPGTNYAKVFKTFQYEQKWKFFISILISSKLKHNFKCKKIASVFAFEMRADVFLLIQKQLSHRLMSLDFFLFFHRLCFFSSFIFFYSVLAKESVKQINSSCSGEITRII